jgi:hypothetical protein
MGTRSLSSLTDVNPYSAELSFGWFKTDFQLLLYYTSILRLRSQLDCDKRKITMIHYELIKNLYTYTTITGIVCKANY